MVLVVLETRSLYSCVSPCLFTYDMYIGGLVVGGWVRGWVCVGGGGHVYM